MKKFDFLTRDHIGFYFKLGSKRNINRILQDISDYVTSFRIGYDTIYYLNPLGRIYVDCDKVRRITNNVEHTIMRNNFWVFSNCPIDWKNEVKLTHGKTTIVSDSMFTRNGFVHFLEVDNVQKMKVNKEKVKRYREMYDLLLKDFGYYPTIVWLTTTELRKANIEKACEGMKVKVYTIDEIK